MIVVSGSMLGLEKDEFVVGPVYIQIHEHGDGFSIVMDTGAILTTADGQRAIYSALAQKFKEERSSEIEVSAYDGLACDQPLPQFPQRRLSGNHFEED